MSAMPLIYFVPIAIVAVSALAIFWQRHYGEKREKFRAPTQADYFEQWDNDPWFRGSSK